MEWEKRLKPSKVFKIFFSQRKHEGEDEKNKFTELTGTSGQQQFQLWIGQELKIKFIQSCSNPDEYIETLGPEDAVVFETGLGSFYWADKIEESGALCFIINPYKFRIIKDSWNKTDKNDSRNMAKALWVHIVTGEFGLPTVYKPTRPVRELRRLFSQYENLNKHLVMLKNSIQAVT